MLKISEIKEQNLLEILVSGTLTKRDYDRILPELEQLLKKHGSLKFLIKLENFSGFELGALWEDIKFDIKHQSNYGKIAVVGEKKWEEIGIKFSALFFNSDLHFFYNNQVDKAENWLKS